MQCLCTVQEGLVRPDVRTRLEAALQAHSVAALGATVEPVEVFWIEIPTGSGYTAGKPSTSSIVGMLVPDGTAEEVREPLMKSVCDAWMEITGCSVDEVVVSAPDVSALAG